MSQHVTTTNQAVRLMGVWVRRADALLTSGAVANAARAVEDERARVAQQERDLAALDLSLAPVPLAG
jgi:hypothetical protein